MVPKVFFYQNISYKRQMKVFWVEKYFFIVSLEQRPKALLKLGLKLILRFVSSHQTDKVGAMWTFIKHLGDPHLHVGPGKSLSNKVKMNKIKMTIALHCWPYGWAKSHQMVPMCFDMFSKESAFGYHRFSTCSERLTTYYWTSNYLWSQSGQ